MVKWAHRTSLTYRTTVCLTLGMVTISCLPFFCSQHWPCDAYPCTGNLIFQKFLKLGWKHIEHVLQVVACGQICRNIETTSCQNLAASFSTYDVIVIARVCTVKKRLREVSNFKNHTISSSFETWFHFWDEVERYELKEIRSAQILYCKDSGRVEQFPSKAFDLSNIAKLQKSLCSNQVRFRAKKIKKDRIWLEKWSLIQLAKWSLNYHHSSSK